jgi:hypothetical protein
MTGRVKCRDAEQGSALSDGTVGSAEATDESGSPSRDPEGFTESRAECVSGCEGRGQPVPGG